MKGVISTESVTESTALTLAKVIVAMLEAEQTSTFQMRESSKKMLGSGITYQL